MPKSLRWGKGVKLIMASKHQRAEGGLTWLWQLLLCTKRTSNTTQIKGLALLLIDNPIPYAEHSSYCTCVVATFSFSQDCFNPLENYGTCGWFAHMHAIRNVPRILDAVMV